MPRKSKVKLTYPEWEHVFQARCRSKRGEHLSDEDRELCNRAFNEDSERYAAMDVEVFNATVPFGSNVKKYR